MSKRVTTGADAQAQDFTLPALEDWKDFARSIQGYQITKELGLDFHKWTLDQFDQWKETKQWDLDVLHLRIMLFYAVRRDYWTGYTYTEHDEMADSLLQAISKKTGLPYTPKK